MTTVYDCAPTGPLPELTPMVTPDVPEAVGTPEMMPVVEPSTSPAGRSSERTDQ